MVGAQKSVTGRHTYRNPDIADRLYGEGEANIWGGRQNYHSENMKRYIYDHDKDILRHLLWI